MSLGKKTLWMLVFLLCVSSVYAWDWDNVKEYDEETRTVTVTNALGLGDYIANITLITELEHFVINGNDKKISEFKVDNAKNYPKAIKELEMYDRNNDMSIMNDEFTYKYKVHIETKTIKDYEEICEPDGFYANESIKITCTKK